MDKKAKLIEAINNNTFRVYCTHCGSRLANDGLPNDYYEVLVFAGGELIFTPYEVHIKFKDCFKWARAKARPNQILMGGWGYSKPLQITICIYKRLCKEFGIKNEYTARGTVPCNMYSYD